MIPVSGSSGSNHIANLLTEHMAATTAITLRQHSRDRDSPEIGNVRIKVGKPSVQGGVSSRGAADINSTSLDATL